MPRPLQRVRLESGLKLNLNSLARQGIVKPGAITGPVGIAWTNGSGQEIASGYITADLSDEHGGWFASDLANWSSAYTWWPARVISAVGNGSSCARICIVARPSCGCLPAHILSRVENDGAGKSLTPRNLRTAAPGVIRGRRRSKRGFARLVASTLTNGNCRQNRNG
jgi:hypothetical protein